MDCPVMLSNRHVHLTQEDADILFGVDGTTFDKYLSGDSGPYAIKETLQVCGPKGSMSGVKVLGPFRKYTQCELLRGDTFKLGVKPPIESSGNLENAAEITLVGPCGTITRKCAIIAHAHIHMKKEIADELGFQDKQAVKVKVPGIRALTFENILIHIGGRGLMMHIDTEEGNAGCIKNGDILQLVTEEN